MEYGTNKNREVPDHHPGGPDLGIYSKVAPLQYRVGDGATGNMPSEKSACGKFDFIARLPISPFLANVRVADKPSTVLFPGAAPRDMDVLKVKN
jgi:hypothetical protein